ncbi:hypothetical protein PYH37_004973 [Sinorhizobium numidicum]|uniref:Uncharacterized protein n=1 Tax=Sinorhizobium numidicum TaxID=680248 RepID=A0ABY8CXD4_9HYPH|nr:hypothetical protein [Sinorhizobium numidicum]WEX76653.1 hypothetical protein PYH37_004973 [Sinorhizobium numidicum]WEX83314.1 hypothetical protein PYH38_005685 [Sinorhizobium numidicum]
MVTLHLPGYEHPVTIHEKYLDEVIPNPKPAKEPKPKAKKPPLYDKPDLRRMCEKG